VARRAQAVLAAAVVVAVALVPMLVAYLQLGHPPDAAARAAEADGPADARRALDRAATRAAARADGAAWTNRSRAYRRANATLAAAASRVEARGARRGAVYRVARAEGVAARLARAECPRGARRAFGPCEAVGGVVLQERGGETAVAYVALRLRVRSPEGRTDATLVVRPRG
jgi:hypothetical protein